MRKFFSFLFILLCFTFNFNIVGCSSDNKISVIYLKNGSKICNINVYKVTGGEMWELGDQNNKVDLEAKYRFKAYTPKDSESDIYRSSPPLELYVDINELMITVVPYKNGYNYWDGIYYSEYWGSRVQVLFSLNTEYYKTYPIKIKEKTNSYTITYYDLSYHTAINNLSELEEYKKTIEIPISEVSRIVYKN